MDFAKPLFKEMPCRLTILSRTSTMKLKLFNLLYGRMVQRVRNAASVNAYIKDAEFVAKVNSWERFGKGDVSYAEVRSRPKPI